MGWLWARMVAVTVLVACGGAAPPAPRPKPPAPLDVRAELAAAEAAYQAKQWPECARRYAAAATVAKDRLLVDALYNGACCEAQGGQPDRAFALLERAVAAGLRDVGHVQRDPDLESLRGDPRWAAFVTGVQQQVARWESSLGQPALRAELLALVEEDQRARGAFIEAMKQGREDPAAAEAMQAIDRKTTTRMKEIVAAHGWPGKSLVGEDGAGAAWLLVQHADADAAFQKQCLALMEPLVAAGEVTPQNYAYLWDRVAVAEQRPQRYGTQFGPDGEPQPMEDPANVDARRRAVGLGTMAEYKRQMREVYGEPKPAKQP